MVIGWYLAACLSVGRNGDLASRCVALGVIFGSWFLDGSWMGAEDVAVRV